MFSKNCKVKLSDLKGLGLSHCPQVYEFIKRPNQGQNIIVMQLLGENLANQKKLLGKKLTIDSSINYLVNFQKINDPIQIQMIDSIEEVHSRGFIHRDIKPSNFVIGKGAQKHKVFIVDFGLAKQHLINGVPIPMRNQADFRGTIKYASLNAHLKNVTNTLLNSILQDLGRRDDLWSFYFVILDFLNENSPWKNSKLPPNLSLRIDSVKDEVKDIKMKSLANPEQYLWTTTTKKIPQVRDIFNHIKSLNYEDKPDYDYIRQKLNEIKHTYLVALQLQQDLYFYNQSNLVDTQPFEGPAIIMQDPRMFKGLQDVSEPPCLPEQPIFQQKLLKTMLDSQKIYQSSSNSNSLINEINQIKNSNPQYQIDIIKHQYDPNTSKAKPIFDNKISSSIQNTVLPQPAQINFDPNSEVVDSFSKQEKRETEQNSFEKFLLKLMLSLNNHKIQVAEVIMEGQDCLLKLINTSHSSNHGDGFYLLIRNFQNVQSSQLQPAQVISEIQNMNNKIEFIKPSQTEKKMAISQQIQQKNMDQNQFDSNYKFILTHNQNTNQIIKHEQQVQPKQLEGLANGMNFFTKNLSIQQAQMSSSSSSYNQGGFNPFLFPPYNKPGQINPQMLPPIQPHLIIEADNLDSVQLKIIESIKNQQQQKNFIQPSMIIAQQDSMNMGRPDQQIPQQQQQQMKAYSNQYNQQYNILDQLNIAATTNPYYWCQCEKQSEENQINELQIPNEVYYGQQQQQQQVFPLPQSIQKNEEFKELPLPIISSQQDPFEGQNQSDQIIMTVEKKREKKMISKYEEKHSKQVTAQTVNQQHHHQQQQSQHKQQQQPQVKHMITTQEQKKEVIHMYSQNVININQLNHNFIPEQNNLNLQNSQSKIIKRQNREDEYGNEPEQLFKIETDRKKIKQTHQPKL